MFWPIVLVVWIVSAVAGAVNGVYNCPDNYVPDTHQTQPVPVPHNDRLQ